MREREERKARKEAEALQKQLAEARLQREEEAVIQEEAAEENLQRSGKHERRRFKQPAPVMDDDYGEGDDYSLESSSGVVTKKMRERLEREEKLRHKASHSEIEAFLRYRSEEHALIQVC